MKMVAAAKVRRARTAVESARPYAAQLSAILSNMAAGADGSAPVLLTGRSTVKTVRLVVMGSDRGLCGGMNSNLIRAALKWVAERQAFGQGIEIVAVGRKMRDGLKAVPNAPLVAVFSDMGRTVEFDHACTIADDSLQAFMSGKVDEVHVLSSHMVSMLTQVPTVKQLIPFEKPKADAFVAAPVYEPGEEAVLETLLPLNLNMQVFAALLETSASEQAARMAAMDSATRNAGEMIKKLSVQYNRTRQSAITKELIEIISGAEAV